MEAPGYAMSIALKKNSGICIPSFVGKLPPKENIDIMKRVSMVFEQAYIRFLDLKKAELQAQQATENLKIIKGARAKAEKALKELKAAQSQLIQSEKMASLGELTAGIAHEIKNPLNFVNNFSEVSVELIDEALEELELVKTRHSSSPDNESLEEITAILNDVKGNLTKVHEHGTRADGIVKSMLQHSRGGSGKMEPTNLNALVKEYVNLAFHGMRAGKNPINAEIDLQLDPKIKTVPMIGEDFSRVVLNLCNNAFDAMRETVDTLPPKLSVRTKLDSKSIHIEVEDNGSGIPEEIKDKILQPFFTTKKGTDGTGLGLSITNDIIKAHGGQLDIQSQPGQTIFKIHLTP
jgi:signal transduction histidine kinase